MNNQEFYGIRINKKIPKLKDNKNINKYYGSIKPSFEGKAYIIEDCKEKQAESKRKKKSKRKKDLQEHETLSDSTLLCHGRKEEWT